MTPVETRRTGLYNCIRSASKFMKLGSELRKTLPEEQQNALQHHCSKMTAAAGKQEKTNHYVYDSCGDTDVKRPSFYTSRHENQLSFPSKLEFVPTVIPPNKNSIEQDLLLVKEQENDYYYNTTMKKLSGIIPTTFSDETTSRDVLITLSPCALAAANAAKQRRHKLSV